MIKGHFGLGLLALLALLILPASVTAQDFRPGYIITVNGDSVRGLVRYGSARRSQRACLFKTARGTKKKQYPPAELNGYGIFGDRSYASIDNPDKPGEKIFARVLATGDMGLLRVSDKYLMRTKTIKLLPPEVKMKIAIENGEAIRTERPYAGILNLAMADCGKATDEVSYTEKELTRAVDEYNLCKNPKYKSIQRKPIAQAGLNVFASYFYSDMNLKYDHASMSPSTFLGYGIGVDFSSPRINDKLFLSLDGAYVDMFYQGLIDGPTSGYYLHSDVFMTFHCIRTSAGLRYNLMEASRTPYFKIGLSRYWVLSNDIHTVIEQELSEGVVLTSETKGGYDVKNPKGIYLSIGYQQAVSRKLKVFAEGRYENMEGFVGTAIQSFSDLANYSVMFGFRLN
jgi:hypothetical protein